MLFHESVLLFVRPAIALQRNLEINLDGNSTLCLERLQNTPVEPLHVSVCFEERGI